MANKPISLYAWNTPNGREVSVALEEMQVPYVVKPDVADGWIRSGAGQVHHFAALASDDDRRYGR